MNALEGYVYQRLHRLRRLTQFAALVFLFIVPVLNKMGVHHIIGGFYSIDIGKLVIVDPALLLQTILLTQHIFIPLLLAALIPIVIALAAGKVFCGWVCPFNLFAEMADKLRRRIRPKTAKVRNSNPKPHAYWLIFGAVLTMSVIVGIPLITLLSMPGLISGQIADLLFFGALGLETLFILFILLLEIFVAPRFWCKYACPVGAALSLFRFRKTMRIDFDSTKCVCSADHFLECHAACPLQLDPRSPDIYPTCYNCGECVDACQNNGRALNLRIGNKELTIPADAARTETPKGH